MVRDFDCRIEANHLGQTWFGSWPISIEYDGSKKEENKTVSQWFLLFKVW